jgi:hypothetical protein
MGVPAARRGCCGVGAASDGAGRAGAPPASGWLVRTGSRDAHAGALSLGTLAPGGGGLGAADAGLMAPWEACADGCGVGATSELPYPGRLTPRRIRAVCASRERCGARLGVPAARHGSFGVGRPVQCPFRHAPARQRTAARRGAARVGDGGTYALRGLNLAALGVRMRTRVASRCHFCTPRVNWTVQHVAPPHDGTRGSALALALPY